MAAERSFTAVALAGGRLERDFRDAGYDVVNKAYLPVGGATMLERVLRALRGAHCVGEIRCVTPAQIFGATYGPAAPRLCDKLIAPGEGLIDSLIAGFDGLDESAHVLVAATDIPLLTASAVDAFADRARSASCDIGYGCVSRPRHDEVYPQVRHTWVRLREGTFCGGGISVIRAGAVAPLVALLYKIAAARKSPLRLALLFSPFLVVRLLLGLVAIPELERRADALSGVTCRCIPCDDAEIAVNVDRLSDLRVVESIIA